MYHRSQCGTDRQGKRAGCMASTMLCRHWWRISGPRTRCTRHCFPQRTRACICSLCYTQRHSYRHNLNAQQNKAEESGDHKHLRVLPRTNALTCVPSLHLSLPFHLHLIQCIATRTAVTASITTNQNAKLAICITAIVAAASSTGLKHT